MCVVSGPSPTFTNGDVAEVDVKLTAVLISVVTSVRNDVSDPRLLLIAEPSGCFMGNTKVNCTSIEPVASRRRQAAANPSVASRRNAVSVVRPTPSS